MRAANELVAEVLGAAGGDGGAGRDDARSRRRGRAAGARARRRAGVQGLSRVSRRRSARRSTSRWCTASRRTGRCAEGDIISLDMGVKLNGFYGDSARDGAGRARSRRTRRRCCGSREEALEQGIAQVRVGGADLGYRPRRPGARRSARVFGGARVRRPRHRRGAARGAADCQLRRAGARPAAGRGHGARDRADGEHGPAGGEGAGGRLDGGDARRQPVGALRAHRRGDEGRPARADGAAGVASRDDAQAWSDVDADRLGAR